MYVCILSFHFLNLNLVKNLSLCRITVMYHWMPTKGWIDIYCKIFHEICLLWQQCNTDLMILTCISIYCLDSWHSDSRWLQIVILSLFEFNISLQVRQGGGWPVAQIHNKFYAITDCSCENKRGFYQCRLQQEEPVINNNLFYAICGDF